MISELTSVAGTSFKTQKDILETKIRVAQRKLDRLKKQLEKSKASWNKGYQDYKATNKILRGLRLIPSQKRNRLCKKQEQWEELTPKMTAEKKGLEDQIRMVETEITGYKTRLAVLEEQHVSHVKKDDEIVKQVFALTKTMVQAMENRRVYLAGHLFDRMVNEDGSVNPTATLISEDGLSKVTARVDKITIIDGNSANQAITLIQNFFSQFKATVSSSVPAKLKDLYELCEKLLFKETKFKPGPGLGLFLGLEFEPTVAPELVQAQQLLKQSVQYDRSKRYIILYQREKIDSNWIRIPQS